MLTDSQAFFPRPAHPPMLAGGRELVMTCPCPIRILLLPPGWQLAWRELACCVLRLSAQEHEVRTDPARVPIQRSGWLLTLLEAGSQHPCVHRLTCLWMWQDKLRPLVDWLAGCQSSAWALALSSGSQHQAGAVLEPRHSLGMSRLTTDCSDHSKTSLVMRKVARLASPLIPL